MPAASCCACCWTIRRSRWPRLRRSGTRGASCTACIPTCAARTTLKFSELGDAGAVRRAVPGPAPRRSAAAHRRLRRARRAHCRPFGRLSAARCRRYTNDGTGSEHPAPEWLGRFVYGLPELYRAAIARRPLRQRRRLQRHGGQSRPAAAGRARLDRARRGRPQGRLLRRGQRAKRRHAPPRAQRRVRSFAPAGHRHQAEVHAGAGRLRAPLLRHRGRDGARRPVHGPRLSERRRSARKTSGGCTATPTGEEPFVRLVKERRGIYRYPEPKMLAGQQLLRRRLCARRRKRAAWSSSPRSTT